MKSSRPTINPKVFEPQMASYLSKLIYAVFDDIRADWNGTEKYSDMIYQNYQNLLLDKKDRCEGLKNRFTISVEVRQYLTTLFGKMIDEIDLIHIIETDNIESVGGKLNNATAECFTIFMWDVASRYKAKFGPTLSAAGDPTQWIHGQMVGFLPAYSVKPMIVAMLSNEFDVFLKSMAWLFANLIWYTDGNITSELFLGHLKQQGLCQMMLDELSSVLRPKKPVVRKKKTIGTVVNATTGVTIDTTINNAVNTESNATTVSNATTANTATTESNATTVDTAVSTKQMFADLLSNV